MIFFDVVNCISMSASRSILRLSGESAFLICDILLTKKVSWTRLSLAGCPEPLFFTRAFVDIFLKGRANGIKLKSINIWHSLLSPFGGRRKN